MREAHIFAFVFRFGGSKPSALGRILPALLIGAVLVGGCATVPDDPLERAEFEERNDPMEPLNRQIFEFNQAADAALLEPVAKTYRFLLPEILRRTITRVLRNLGEPLTFVHDVLQAEAERAGETSARFIINSTLGLGGILDLADSEFGIERHNEDFGQTLAVWGIDGGPFVMLPFVGPSNPRDSVGGLADIFIDPVSITIDQLDLSPASPVRLGLTVVDARERNIEILDELEASSLDFYSTMRSAYRQNRAKEIRNGAPPPEQDMDDIFEDFEMFEEGEGIGNRPTNF